MVNPLVAIYKNKRVYRGIASGWTIPATPTDMVTLTGASNRVIRLIGIIIDGLQTTAGINKLFLIKRSTLDTTGTFVADSINVHDSSDLASLATFGHYTANPGALGTAIGNFAVNNLLCQAPAGTTNDKLILSFDYVNAEEITLRSATEQICLNFNGAALPTGLVLNVTFIWIEE